MGYLNNPKTRDIDVDSDKAPKVKKLFEMYATGAYTLHSLANWCKAKDLHGNLGKEIALSNVQSILQNIFYIGLMKYDGEISEGQHEPLISKKLFDSCQEVMEKRGKVHELHKNDFAFLGLLKCSSCGCSITAEKQKGHNYYRCTHKKGLCQEKHYLREEALTQQIKSFFQKVSLSNHDTEKVLAELNKLKQEAKHQAIITLQNLKHELKNIESKLEKILDVHLEQTITKEEYTNRKQKLINIKLEIQQSIDDFEQIGLSWLEPAKEFVLNLNKAFILQNSDNLSEFPSFLKTIGSNHLFHHSQLVFSFRQPYNLVVKIQRKNLTIPLWRARQDFHRASLRKTLGFPAFLHGGTYSPDPP